MLGFRLRGSGIGYTKPDSQHRANLANTGWELVMLVAFQRALGAIKKKKGAGRVTRCFNCCCPCRANAEENEISGGGCKKEGGEEEDEERRWSSPHTTTDEAQ